MEQSSLERNLHTLQSSPKGREEWERDYAACATDYPALVHERYDKFEQAMQGSERQIDTNPLGSRFCQGCHPGCG